MSQPITATEATTAEPHPVECDVIMKGGITSGVIYPRALKTLSDRYRLRGIGGTSAGAIGAACAAAAELGRAGGGFDRLEDIPERLGDGALARLFQPARSTRQLLRVLMAATGNGIAGKGPKRPWLAVPVALVLGFPVVVAATIAAAVLVGWTGSRLDGGTGVLLAVPGIVLVVLAGTSALAARVYWKLTRAVPANQLGICTGLSTGSEPGFTDWLSDTIDDLAGLAERDRPLTFGDLWGDDNDALTDAHARDIDLRMITTCISRSRPYEMPWSSREFFYDPTVWRTLFPAHVVDALERDATPGVRGNDLAAEDDEPAGFRATADLAAREQGLRRLPDPRDLPVIVATRMSLSFPLLISAVPLWSIDFRSPATREWKASLGGTAPAQPPEQPQAQSPENQPAPAFELLWFTDGGLCSNFPVHLFDSPLATRPTYAINLGRVSDGVEPTESPVSYIEIATTNRDGLAPTYRSIGLSGRKAVTGFASAAFDTIRNWQDNSYLDVPGQRDRIVRILQTKDEGGLNLYMGTSAIQRLARRGKAGAETLIDQFTQPHYLTGATPTRTGWENHRWVRYRALLATLPDFVRGYVRGEALLRDIPPSSPPSYPASIAGQQLAEDLSTAIAGAAAVVEAAGDEVVAELTGSPARAGVLRRTPTM